MFDIIRSRMQKTEIEKGQDPNFLPKKRHFRETEEWKKKKKRIIAKIRTMGRLNLALIMARMPVSLFSFFFNF
uniref:Uncharacterized protein n=1 Tax=Panagrolaimus sp. PS1159 TaxID=55785 RepID=A0AC35F9S6_9BILA